MIFRPKCPESLHAPSAKSLGGPYGNGPYRKASGTPSSQVIDALTEAADKLRGLSDTEPNDWAIQWDVYESAREQDNEKKE